MKKGHFIPSHLKDLDGSMSTGMTSLSPNFFKIGLEHLEKARAIVAEKKSSDGFDHSHYCFPAIIMLCTSFEAYIHENIALSKFMIETDKKPNWQSMIDDLDKIKNEQEIKDKVKSFYKKYDRSLNGLDTNSEIYQNLIALFRLRNEIIHYSPEMIEIKKWPLRLQEAFHKSNPKLIAKTCWTSTFSTVTVSEWAYSTVKNAIREFAKISGAQDPFGEETPYPWNWEKEKET